MEVAVRKQWVGRERKEGGRVEGSLKEAEEGDRKGVRARDKDGEKTYYNDACLLDAGALCERSMCSSS